MNSIARRFLLQSAVTIGCLAPSLAFSADDGWLHEFDAATAAAKQQGKDILIDFSGTDWCLPCRQLWEQTLSRPEFVGLASRHFVLLDIDNLVRDEMPKGRKERYEELERRYGIQAHPTVVLATSDGLPYAATGLIDAMNEPASYWRHLEELFERGKKFNAALSQGGPRGLDNAQSIVDVLSELRPDFVTRFYADKIELLRRLSPADETGYLAFIDARKELLAFEWKLHEGFITTLEKWDKEAITSRWVDDYSPPDVDAIIKKHQLTGASLKEALLGRVFLEVDAGQWQQSLSTLEKMVAIRTPSSRFEQANFVEILIPSSDEMLRHIRAARAKSEDPFAQVRAVYSILRNDVQCRTPTSCCNHSFTTQMHYIVAGAAYGEMLLRATADLQGEEKARAIANGLKDIELFANGSIGRIVCKLMPELVGKESAKKMLPPRYASWLDD